MKTTTLTSIVLLFALIAGMLGGCAATEVALERKDLKILTKMSKTIFLDLDNQIEKTAFVEVKNTTDKLIDFNNALQKAVLERGYTLVESPKDAAYIFQANILYVGEADPSAIRSATTKGYGAPLAGALGGGAVGYALGGKEGAALGGVAGGLLASATDFATGYLVKDVTYSIMTDIQLTEKTLEEKKIHQVRVASTAEQVNLEWQEAEPQLITGLARSLSGVL